MWGQGKGNLTEMIGNSLRINICVLSNFLNVSEIGAYFKINVKRKLPPGIKSML
jgi:hypothetical protein